MYRLVFVARRRKRGLGFILRKKESGPVQEGGRRGSEREHEEWRLGWIGATEKKRHISHASRRNEERESPTDFPRGMQIRIEISRENVKDPMRFVRVAARCECLARARAPLEIIIRNLLSRARGKAKGRSTSEGNTSSRKFMFYQWGEDQIAIIYIHSIKSRRLRSISN